jgi:hypothetical protein
MVLLKAFFKLARLLLGEPRAFTWLERRPTSSYLCAVDDMHIHILSIATHGEVEGVQEGKLPCVLDVGPLITICSFTVRRFK